MMDLLEANRSTAVLSSCVRWLHLECGVALVLVLYWWILEA